MKSVQPKITQKLLLRTAIGVFALAGLVMAFRWYKTRETDPRGPDTLDTAGWIAAVETANDNKHVVAFKDDGTLVRQPDASGSVDDKDPAWRPDGSDVFFASNRLKGKFTIFRWFPDGHAAAEMRSLVGLPQSAPAFLTGEADKHENATGLVVASGRVMMIDPKEPALHQVLPPLDPKKRMSVDPETGEGVSPLEGVYEHFGTSFRIAKWTPDRKTVFAVMKGDTGEVLLYQKLDPTVQEDSRPRPIAAGDRIDFDVDQNTGALYLDVQNFQWPPMMEVPPEFIKNGKITVPFKHVVGVGDAANPAAWKPIITSNADKDSFTGIVAAPTGDRIVFVHGAYGGSGNLKPDGLVVVFLSGDRKGQGGKIADGEVYEPCFSPDAKKIAFAKRESSTSRPIYVIEEGGSSPRRVSPETGVFGNPTFSPQTKG